jgi:hypothetical protein
MRLSDVFGAFFQAAKAEGIPIEADPAPAPVTQQEQPPKPPQPDTPAAADQTAAMQAQLETQQRELAEARERLATMERDAQQTRLSALIERGPSGAWHGALDQHRAILAALGEGTPAFQAYVTQQDAVAELARQSALFQHTGTDRPGTSSTWAQIEVRARKLAAEQGITFEQASVQVMDADPALYRQYLAEQRGA